MTCYKNIDNDGSILILNVSPPFLLSNNREKTFAFVTTKPHSKHHAMIWQL